MDQIVGTAKRTAASMAAARPGPELSIVVPTYNERANIPLLIERIAQSLRGIDWEVIFVDDNSPDGSAALARSLGDGDARVRCLRRIGRRGLAGACLEGMLASQGRFIAVIDADLQHDESLLADMTAKLRTNEVDVVVASRYIGVGSAAGLGGGLRALISRSGNTLAQRILNVNLSDPMSGFFMVRREVVETAAPSLSHQGFKILLDLLTSSADLRIVELPYTFRERQHGESKLDARIAFDFLGLLLAKKVSDTLSFRFALFCLVGLTGVAVHMATLLFVRDLAQLSFLPAQMAATVVAIAWNFVLNNALTYHDQRLAGWDFVTGLIRFEIICAVGALSNVGVANWIFHADSDWWLAGFAGAMMSATWNYVVSAAIVWRAR
jgi:dolichol-phosphate mannosyltransferase